MSLAYKQFKVYARGGLILAVALAVGLVLIYNRSHEVCFWFFGLTDEDQKINVVYLIVCTAVATLFVRWALSFAWSMIRDWREVSRAKALKAAEVANTNRAAELDMRERRIDEKVRGSLTGGTSHDNKDDTD